MTNGWTMPGEVTPTQVVAVVPPPTTAANAPSYFLTKYSAVLEAMFRCAHCGHTWSAPEVPYPRFCPRAMTDDVHAQLYPLGYPF